MAWLTKEEIQDRFPDTSAEIEQYYPAALSKLNEMTCNALIDESTTDSTGVVGGDGLTVSLPGWFSEITAVAGSDGKPLRPDMWQFDPTNKDESVNASSNIRYGKKLTLLDERNTGEVLTISGTYGFRTLPDELKNVLYAIMSAYMSRANGEDGVTNKSIEDVTVSQDSKSDRTPEAIAMDTQFPIANKWTVCEDKHSLGDLAFPKKRYQRPYYVGAEEAEWGGVYPYAIGNAL